MLIYNSPTFRTFGFQNSLMDKKKIALAFVLSFVVYFALTLLFKNHQNPDATSENIQTSLIQAVVFSIVTTLLTVIGNKFAKK